MGMTIENAITWLNTDDFESKGFADATSVAIDTMRKYQKIKEICDKFATDVTYLQEMAFYDIKDVIMR